MFGATPKSGQAKLCIGVEKGFFEDTLLWVEELTNEGVVESGLPLLNESHLKAAIVCSVRIDWDWSPDIQVVMVLPIAKCQFSLNQSLVRELEVLSGATVLCIAEPT